MQVYAYFSSFSIEIRLLRFYRRLFPLILLPLIAVYDFIAMEITRANAIYYH